MHYNNYCVVEGGLVEQGYFSVVDGLLTVGLREAGGLFTIWECYLGLI